MDREPSSGLQVLAQSGNPIVVEGNNTAIRDEGLFVTLMKATDSPLQKGRQALACGGFSCWVQRHAALMHDLGSTTVGNLRSEV
jgi:hypothetical protein